MLQTPMDVLSQFPVRKSKHQKQAFRDAVCSYAKRLGYPVSVEEGSFGCCNVIFGNPEEAKYLLTAHYDTPAAMLLPNLIAPTNPTISILYQLLIAVLLVLPPFLISFFLSLGVLFAGGFWINSVHDTIVVFAMIIWYACFFLLCLFRVGMLYYGPANKNNANDNTSGVVTLLEVAGSLQKNQRNKVCFVLFDLEEKGLLGSRSYRKAHRATTDQQLVINLDCVGDGDCLRIFPTKKIRQDRRSISSFYRICGYWGNKSLLIHEKGLGYYPSDHKHFPNAVAIVALRKSKLGPYLGKIHTCKDTVLDTTNVNILRAALISYISCNAVN